jgi:hypothetical protein
MGMRMRELQEIQRTCMCGVSLSLRTVRLVPCLFAASDKSAAIADPDATLGKSLKNLAKQPLGDDGQRNPRRCPTQDA